MQPIPVVLITVGGLCILSGLRKTNPVALIKDAISGTPVPGADPVLGIGTPIDFGSRTDTSANPTGAGSANAAEHDAPNGFARPSTSGNSYNQKAV